MSLRSILGIETKDLSLQDLAYIVKRIHRGQERRNRRGFEIVSTSLCLRVTIINLIYSKYLVVGFLEENLNTWRLSLYELSPRS